MVMAIIGSALVSRDSKIIREFQGVFYRFGADALKLWETNGSLVDGMHQPRTLTGIRFRRSWRLESVWIPQFSDLWPFLVAGRTSRCYYKDGIKNDFPRSGVCLVVGFDRSIEGIRRNPILSD